jgi:uncharacterized Zn-binding protein involved in type VI secretion
MLFIAKLGDIVGDRGVITGPGHPTVLLNGIPLAAAGDIVTPHSCCGVPGCEIHCVAVLLTGRRANITVNGQPIITQTDLASCLDPITMQRVVTTAMVQ